MSNLLYKEEVAAPVSSSMLCQLLDIEVPQLKTRLEKLDVEGTTTVDRRRENTCFNSFKEERVNLVKSSLFARFEEKVVRMNADAA